MSLQNSLVRKENGDGKLSVYLNRDSIKNWINSMVGSENGQRFIAQILSAVSSSKNPKKYEECDPATIVSAALVGESLKLAPSPQMGQFYIVPFGKKAVPVVGYKGYVQLAIRSGQYKRLNVIAIKKGELKHFDPLTEDFEIEIIEDDAVREQSDTIGYFAMFEYLNGFRKIMYWSRKKMEEHAKKHSKAYQYDKSKKLSRDDDSASQWTKDFDAQGLKTMIRQLLSRWGMMSIEIQKAFESDNFDSESRSDFVTAESTTATTEPAEPAAEDDPGSPLAGESTIDTQFETTTDSSSGRIEEEESILTNLRRIAASLKSKRSADNLRKAIEENMQTGEITDEEADELFAVVNDKYDDLK